jgi:uncharacterized membrane protein (UPF0127 family)
VVGVERKGRTMKCMIRNTTRDRVVAEDAKVANGMIGRLRGLITRGTLGSGEAVVLTPCTGVHMFWTHTPLDVIFLNRYNQVVCAVSGFPGWAVLPWVRDAASAIGVPVGTIHETRTAVGDLMSIEARADAPRSVRDCDQAAVSSV